ncbi:glutamine/asparagine-rich protein mdt-30-like [Plectropomus leopardus]|uniref:glutamine/asparagine-rich protein mdt-30-like n=1 Tax=Plectropomus leopardus TaxID=160734 RepID=UPI001C4B1574|nr:glutamine/asparagine-rich protein mdt-30-like [Plectropomus leopardus]
MIIFILLSTITVSAVPVCPNALPPPLSQGGAAQAQRVVEVTNQQSVAFTPAPLSPNTDQPQPGVPEQPGPHWVPQQPGPHWVPQQPGPQGGPQFLLPAHHYTWPTLAGSPMIIPLQPGVYGAQPANQPTLPQQPLIFPSYSYFPLFSSPYRNQLISPYGFPMILESPPPQTSGNQPHNNHVLPVETPGAGPPGDVPQQVQQQQNPQVVYMLQQPKGSTLGSLSSEELQMAAEMGRLGVYLTTLLTNSPSGAVQPVNQAAGLANSEQQSIQPTVAGGQQTQGPASSGPQLNANSSPVGLEAATVQTPIEAKPTQGNHV